MRDAERNSISMLGYANFSHKTLLNMNSDEKKKLFLENGLDWDELDDGLKYGYYFKRKIFKREIDNVKRRKVDCFAKKFYFSEENVKLIFEKEVEVE